ncbi:MAG TPA: peptidase E [Solirubrobacteraceae bacterium]|nr:peptidase E [Solirubrobacteraceae bacterium]
MASSWIVAMGGGSFWHPYDPTRDAFIFSLARRKRPRVGFVATAGGDSDTYTANFFRAMSEHDVAAVDVPLFNRRDLDLRRAVLDLDVVFVGGGNTLSLLAVWRAHGLDQILREAWESGIVMCGVSAGMNCWFEQSVTDSYSLEELRPLDDGLGFLTGSCCPHYSDDDRRRPAYHQFMRSGELRAGVAADDSAALVYEGTVLAEVVRWADEGTGYRVSPANGEVEETALPSRRL